MVANFAKLRLEELTDAALLAFLKERGIRISSSSGRLQINAPAGALDDSLRAELVRRKPALLAILDGASRPLVRADASGAIGLTPHQERLWIAWKFSRESTAYSMPEAYLVEAPLSPSVLRQAAGELARRQEVLRAYFAEREGEPVQLLAEEASVPVEFTDFSARAPEEAERAARELIRREAQKPFDLERPPLFRVHLIRLKERRHVLFLNIHHIIADLPSLRILRRELTALYAAALHGAAAELPPLPVQYRDYVLWERERLSHAAIDEQVQYWKTKLAGASPSPQLPFARPRPPAPSFRGAAVPVSIPKPLADELSALAREAGASFFMTLLAAFSVLLHRYSGETDLCIGAPVTGRTRIETEPLIGLFVNLLILRCRPEGDLGFRELLSQVRETALEAYAHADAPFQRLATELGAPIVFSLDPPAADLHGHAVPLGIERDTAKFDLLLQLTEGPEGISGVWEYATDVFDSAGVEMFSGAFLFLLREIVAFPDRPLARLRLAASAPASSNRRSYPRNQTIPQLFAEQARRRPRAVALRSGAVSLTYEELDRKTNQLARYLRARGVGRESLVGLCLERSVDAIIAMLGILKAGGAYVPLDPSYPAERLRSLLTDSEITLLIAGANLPDHPAPVVTLGADWPQIVGESDDALDLPADPEALAYVMYTSGSTGKPNGVLIPHRGVVRLVKNADYARLDETEVFLQFAPLSFDASTFEIWAPLLNGGCLALMPPGECSLSALGEGIRAYGVTTLWLTAGLFHAIVEERIEILRPLRQLLAGGDVLSPKHVRRFRSEIPECRLINGYGPTENTTFTCCYTVPADSPARGSVPIGFPISNTDVYLLDAGMSPVPPGAPGEIYIGGDGLARGYRNNPELTAQKFVPDPFSGEPGARLFRSGDLARLLPGGCLEFLGRSDEQVKINGFRVEPGEIEAVLAACPGVAGAVVVARENAAGGKNLAAYVVPVRSAPAHRDQLLQLRSRLRRSLPAFLQPSTITFLDKLPLTENGKLDRAALPVPVQLAAAAAPVCNARSDKIEARLLTLWEEVLGIHPIALNDDFFNLGGHSVLALRLFARIEAEWGLRLPLSLLLKAPTVELLAKALREGGAESSWTSLVAVQTGGSRPPLYLVSGVGGNVVRFHLLARHLGPDQPVFALQPPGLDGRQPFLTRLEDLAAHHVREIRARQPRGPYYLAGYSFGGAVVFEMARQLEAQGERPALVVLLDAPEWRYAAKAMTWPRRWSLFEARLARFIFGPRRLGYLHDRLKRRAIRRLYQLCGFFHAPLPQKFGDIVDVNTHAVRAYRPQPYGGQIVLLRTAGNLRLAGDDGTLGWGALSLGGVEVHEIPGTHEDLTTEPNVQFIARILSACLSAAK